MKNGKEGNQHRHELVNFFGKQTRQGSGEMAWASSEQTESSRIEAVGHVANHIVEYFNNIFTMIMGCGESIREGLPEHDPLKPYVHQILASSERATLLTRGLLAFTKKQVMNPKSVDLNQIVSSIRKLIQRVVGSTIELKTHLSTAKPVVWGDEVQIEQALMNLATNARDAMPDGGTLIIQTEVLNFRTGFADRDLYDQPWKCAVLAVSDTGPGMDEETKKRIFEPFYTTKETGRGIGLGLSIVNGIVKQHNGSINVDSEKGRGTTFKLYLPLLARPVISILPDATIKHVYEGRQRP